MSSLHLCQRIYSDKYMMQFPRLPITLPPFIPTLMSYRWNDEEDCEPLPKKSLRNHRHHQPIRRRIPKRYSDIVVPSSTKIYPSRKDGINREKQTLLPNRRHSLKPLNETVYCFNSHKKKSRENKHNETLAHRMQAAMSTELMNSLDRNFVFGDRKQLTNHLFAQRSQSFNISKTWNKKIKLIPRVKMDFNKEENLHLDEPTPDYDIDDIIIRTIKNDKNIHDEPIIDYDDSSNKKNLINDESTTQSDPGISSSFIVPQTSTISTDELTSIPPPPPPLPNLNTIQPKKTFHCRTIADELSSDHKLILKDCNESKAQYLILQRASTHYQSIVSNDHETDLTTICAKVDEQIQDCLTSSSPTTSMINDNEYEQNRSSSSKIYNDYKKRASLPSTILSHSIIIHPMHTRIGLRSSTSSSSTNEKLTDMTLSSKQMNVCVINQLNEHLSTRFRKQQSSLNTNHTEQQSYDPPPPPPEFMIENNNQSNVYDEPNDILTTKPIYLSTIPPPPPPLPVGGFRPINPPINRSSNPQRTSIMTLSHEANNIDIACSTGNSTVSSNLSDTRILRELRENPLFTRAKQHLDIEPGSNGRRSGRRLIGSTTKITPNETVSYLRLDNCSKADINKSDVSKEVETIIMLPNELDAIIGKRTKSTNDINQVKSRSCTKSLIQSQCRQSELELIFKKRAQRSEHNLT